MDGSGTHARSNVSSYLTCSILNLLCCCLPLGIVAVIFSVKADTANNQGDVLEARKSAQIAKILNIVGLVCGLILIILVIVLNSVALYLKTT